MMKTSSVLVACVVFAGMGSAAADASWKYTAPTDYTKQDQAGFAAYTKITGPTFCMLGLYNPRAMTGTLAAELGEEWKLVVEKQFTPSNVRDGKARTTKGKLAVATRMAALSDGTNQFFGELNVVSTGAAVGSLLVVSNSATTIASCRPAATKLLDSLGLDGEVAKPAAPPPSPSTPPAVAGGPTTVVAKWGTSTHVMRSGFSQGAQRFLYDFKADGTYTFRFESWGGHYNANYYYLKNESGTYTVAGDKLTVSPKTAIGIERGKDAIKSQKKLPLEKTTYTFGFHYFSGSNVWALILTPPKPTVRDVAFSTNNEQFTKSYVYQLDYNPSFTTF